MTFMPTRSTVLAMAVTMLAVSPAFADPSGDWRVADGTAVVRIKKCGASAYCGFVVQTSTPAGKDIHNPNPSLRSRSVMGLEVLINMQKGGENVWSGSTYNAEDGQTYSAKISLQGEQVLSIQGCVPGGGACGSESWARVK
jgi:uncharacterized protein (DUF2147 family)